MPTQCESCLNIAVLQVKWKGTLPQQTANLCKNCASGLFRKYKNSVVFWFHRLSGDKHPSSDTPPV